MKTLLLTSKKLLLLSSVLSGLVMSPLAIAEETNGNFPMCRTHSDLKELWSALSNHDNRQTDALLKDNNCFYPKAGIKISVINKIGVIYKVRVYIEDDSVVLYTSSQGYD